MAVNWTLPTKLCGLCKRELTLAHFHKDSAPGRKRGQRWCRECTHERSRKSRFEKMKLKRIMCEINPSLFKRKIRIRTSKICCICKRELSLDNFYIHRCRGYQNYQSQCIECKKSAMKEARLRGVKYPLWFRIRRVRIPNLRTSKKCYNCKQELSLDKFYIHRKHGYQTQCKECTKKGIKETRFCKRGLL